jgi:Amt family ammonium transporter
LWFGWFGFNAGSALSAGTSATLALVNTQIAAGAAAFAWVVVEWVYHGKPTTLGVASGLVAGLVVITPAAGFVSPVASIAIGFIAGMVCFLAIIAKARLGYDDSLDAFGIHGVGGALGAILTGVFASAVWGGTPGLLEGNTAIMGEQLLGVVATALYAGAVTFGLLKLIDATLGLRVKSDTERDGLDTSLHGERAYGTPGARMLETDE